MSPIINPVTMLSNFFPSFLGLSQNAFIYLDKQVHGWYANASKVNTDTVRSLLRLLSDEERHRATRYRFLNDQHGFVFRRGLLRCLLGSYLERDPASVQIRYNDFGKPNIPDENIENSLQFNLSHSNEYVLYAFTRIGRIGVDIECLRPLRGMNAIAKAFFSDSENAGLDQLTVIAKQKAFYRCWTRKEAFVKAIGEGLSHLDTIGGAVLPGKQSEINTIEWNYRANGKWSLQSFDAIPGYTAAIAVEANQWIQKWRHLSP